MSLMKNGNIQRNLIFEIEPFCLGPTHLPFIVIFLLSTLTVTLLNFFGTLSKLLKKVILHFIFLCRSNQKATGGALRTGYKLIIYGK